MCINYGYYFKNYDHSRDLSDNLGTTVLGNNQEFENFFSIGFLGKNGTVSRKFNFSENGINPNNGTITYNNNGNSFDNNGISIERAFLGYEAFKLLATTMGFNFQERDFDLESLRVVDTGKHTKVYKESKYFLAIIYNEDEISLSENSYLI